MHFCCTVLTDGVMQELLQLWLIFEKENEKKSYARGQFGGSSSNTMVVVDYLELLSHRKSQLGYFCVEFACSLHLQSQGSLALTHS